MDSNNIKALLPIEERGEKQLVNARMLHGFLGVGRDFSSWIKGRIKQYDFIRDEDYIIHSPDWGSVGYNNLGGQARIEYGLTLDMAKELCMVENNEKGRRARRYFIACEKKYKTMVPQLPGDYLSALKALVVSEEEKLQLVAQNKELAEEKQALQDITKPHGYIRIGDAAKIINYPGLGPKNMFKFLCKYGFLRKVDRDDKSYSFYHKYAKYFKERATQQNGGHEGMPDTQVVINMDGVTFLHRKILKEMGSWYDVKTREELISGFKERV